MVIGSKYELFLKNGRMVRISHIIIFTYESLKLGYGGVSGTHGYESGCYILLGEGHGCQG